MDQFSDLPRDWLRPKWFILFNGTSTSCFKKFCQHREWLPLISVLRLIDCARQTKFDHLETNFNLKSHPIHDLCTNCARSEGFCYQWTNLATCPVIDCVQSDSFCSIERPHRVSKNFVSIANDSRWHRYCDWLIARVKPNSIIWRPISILNLIRFTTCVRMLREVRVFIINGPI